MRSTQEHLRLVTKDALQRIAGCPKLEGAWLNTLSRLEFLGVQKIMEAMGERHPSARTLDHLRDEAGHALAFRELAEGLETQGDSYLALREGLRWFESIDTSVATLIGPGQSKQGMMHPREACYLMVTALIEERAMMLYPLYMAASADEEVKRTLRVIIQEEAAHRGPLTKAAERGWTALNLPSLSHVQAEEAANFEAFMKAARSSQVERIST